MNDLGILASAYIVDLLIGDPRQLPHPVRVIGSAIEKVERLLRVKMIDAQYGPENSVEKKNVSHRLREKSSGVILVLVVVGMTFALFYTVCRVLFNSGALPLFSYVSILILVYLAATTIATRELLCSAKNVIDEADTGTIENAREKLGMIVGRDTKNLDKKNILRATIETLSENASDGIIAPMIYFAIGGLPLAMTYKAINTLDSMVGYKNERYLNFGWASARLDDIANFIPARITGSIIVISGFIVSAFVSLAQSFSRVTHSKQGITDSHGISGLRAFRTMIRDGGRHASPNSGIPESAMAGALGVQLGGPSEYGGVVYEKPFIGEERRNSAAAYLYASEMALKITKITSILGLLAALALLYLRTSLWR
jgi:adenosylcobinamide-phosphate synthase